jgi:O-acetyl-ADP-ribose deacetylase (regulator of RNase III)
MQIHKNDNMKNKEALRFIYDRMINKYGENPNYDYMQNFEKVIEEIETTPKNSLNINVISGDISKIKSDAIITAINGSGAWFGGIDNVIRNTYGDYFHNKLLKNSDDYSFEDGKAFFISGEFQSANTFQNVIFVIDNLKKLLREIIFNGLLEADKQKLTSITIPTLRMGVMSRVVEETEDEALEEMRKGVQLFKSYTPYFTKNITFVVHENAFLTERLKQKIEKII